MKYAKGNCIIAQSGGPTAVINASAYGCIKEFMASMDGTVYAGLYGIKGILEEKIINVSAMSSGKIECLKFMPSAAFGSSRYQLKNYKDGDEEYKKLFQIFKKYNIKYFFYIGGNDSMDTASKVFDYATLTGYELYVCGIPKTIDNDLVLTDHCPGFGSAAKFVATAGMEIWLDINTYDKPSVMVMEVMGRDTGWIALASNVLKSIYQGINMLVYLPEETFYYDSFMSDVNNALAQNNKLMIVISEGLKNKNGDYVGTSNESHKDSFGHRQLGGVGRTLQQYVQNEILNEVKLTELGVLQRCSMRCNSETDRAEAEMAGNDTVRYALSGHSGFMTALSRKASENYECETKMVKLKDVCNRVRHVPSAWMKGHGQCDDAQVLKYMKPLIFDGETINQLNNIKQMASAETFR